MDITLLNGTTVTPIVIDENELQVTFDAEMRKAWISFKRQYTNGSGCLNVLNGVVCDETTMTFPRAMLNTFNEWLDIHRALGNVNYNHLAIIEQGRLPNNILTPFINDGNKVNCSGNHIFLNANTLRRWMTQHYGVTNLNVAKNTRERLQHWVDKPMRELSPLSLVRIMPKLKRADEPEVLVFCEYSEGDTKSPWAKVLLSYEVDEVVHYVERRRSEIKPLRSNDINAVGQATVRALWDDVLRSN